MPAAPWDISIEQGADWDDAFTIVNDDDGLPMDLTNFTGKMQIRETANSTDFLAEVDVTFPNPTSGEVMRALTAALTQAIAVAGNTYANVSNYVYDFYLVDNYGHAVRVMNGFAKISPGVTKWQTSP